MSRVGLLSSLFSSLQENTEKAGGILDDNNYYWGYCCSSFKERLHHNLNNVDVKVEAVRYIYYQLSLLSFDV